MRRARLLPLSGICFTLLLPACGRRGVGLPGVAPAEHQPAPAGAAAPHALSGVVRDDQSDALLADVWVSLHADSTPGARALAGTRTDARGAYRLPRVPAGRWWVRLQRLGYQRLLTPVRIGDCGVQDCDDRRNFYLHSQARF